MEYTTDTGPIVEKFLTDQHAEARQTELNLALDAQALTFCADIRQLDGKPEDPALTAEQEQNAASTDEATTRRERFEKKLGDEPAAAPFDTARRGFLRQFVASIEGEHAAHAAIADMARTAGNTDEAEAHEITMLRCDGMHTAALAELDALA